MANQSEITATSAAKLREMTRPLPAIPDDRCPRCYDQCVEAPGEDDGDEVAAPQPPQVYD